MKRESFTRFNVVGWVMTLAFIVIFAWVIRLQIGPERGALTDLKKYKEKTKKTIYPERGNIYDRWGRLLAGNLEVYEIGVDINKPIDKETIMATLSETLELSSEEYRAMRDQLYPATPPPPGRAYAVLAKFIPPEEVEAIQKKAEEYNLQAQAASRSIFGKAVTPRNLYYLEYSPMLKRSYPEGSLAANILGFYPYYNMKNAVGTYGVEQQYNDLLGGTPYDVMIENDPNAIRDVLQIPAGASMLLTIDREIQAMAENVLDSSIAQNGAAGGTIMIMDPRTGEILAAAVQPRMDLNEYWTYKQVYQVTEEDQRGLPFNRAIGTTFEPGSVFKVLTMAAGLDSGAIEPDSVMTDTGTYLMGGVAVHNWDQGAYGEVTMTECMQYSLNVCLSWIADRMGASTFYDYMQRFGMGQLTRVDMAGEGNYPLAVPGDPNWYEINLATNSFGQGIAMTPIQLVTAIGAIANDGKMVAPHVVKAVIQDGEERQIEPSVIGTPISSQTAHELSEILANSIEQEGNQPGVEGYRIAGKTGTAEIAGPDGYTSSLTNATFVGWGPVDDPRFLIYVWFEKPQSDIWGSTVAAPVFKEVMTKLVVLMDIPPDAIRLGVATNP